MKLGIMQPYIFPYIGYFHLIDSVDTFVFYDDVNFVNSGWVNRNKILINNKEFLFTVPSDWSQNKKINEKLLEWLSDIYISLSELLNYMNGIHSGFDYPTSNSQINK